MALARFGNFAVEWSKVYAVIVSADGTGDPLIAQVHADVPGAEIGRQIGVAVRDEARRVVAKTTEDSRFRKITDNLIVDLSKIAAVILNDDKADAAISFDLGAGRGAAIKIDPMLAEALLTNLSK